MESLSRISAVLETARDLTLEAAQSASASGRLRKEKPLSSRETRKLLNSRMDREVLDGLKRVITVRFPQLFTYCLRVLEPDWQLPR